MAMSALEKVRAELADARSELNSEQTENERLRQDRDHWRDARLPDKEAEALAGCARALAEMLKTDGRNVSSDFASSFGRPTFGNTIEERPSALAHPVGRVLLALAARYGLEIEAVRPEPRVVEGQRLVAVPGPIAEELHRMAAQGHFG